MSARARLLAWGRLARLSLAPSALADAAAGLAIGGAGTLPAASEVALALSASACAYHGGMVLNDWADRREDALGRADRPIPSGAVPALAALVAGLALLALAIALAAALSPRAAAWMAGLVALVLAYDLAGRGAWRGPVLLGACRAANLGFGLYHASALGAGVLDRAPPWAPAILALYFGYVLCASRVARLEDVASDAEVGSSPPLALRLCAAALVAVACIHAYRGPVWPTLAAFAVAAAGAIGLLRAASTPGPWTRALAGRATGLALRRLLVFTATATLASSGGFLGGRLGIEAAWSASDAHVVAALILCGFPLSAALRKVFPPT